jgi:hypothetical protein
MREFKKYYLQILRIELADLEEDLELLIDECDLARKDKKITEHVWQGNRILYENEKLGIREFRKVIRYVRPGRFESLDTLISTLKSKFLDVVKDHGLAEAIIVCVNRKLDKVARYVAQ